jgi:hypothetical protein
MSDLKLTVTSFINYVRSVKRLDRDVVLGYVTKLERQIANANDEDSVTADDAPAHWGNSEAAAWASGYEAGRARSGAR